MLKAAFGRVRLRGSLRSPCSPANTDEHHVESSALNHHELRARSVVSPGVRTQVRDRATSTAGIEEGGVARRATGSGTPASRRHQP